MVDESTSVSSAGADTSVTETITVPEHATPAQMAKICRQVARVMNNLSGRILLGGAAGAGNPIVQAIVSSAAAADQAAVQLDGPSRIMPPQFGQVPPGFGRA